MGEDDFFFELFYDLPREGVGRDCYTRRAFEMLPELEDARLLDVGCGSGAPTMELARLSGGQVTGVDFHQPFLDRLASRTEEAGLANRIRTVNCSMSEMRFADESFDIVWSECSIFGIGFRQGLTEWRRLIKPGGFLVVHELAWLRPDPPAEIRDYFKECYPGIQSIPENLSTILACGYELVGHFALPEDAWWVEYYNPLQARVHKLRDKYAGVPETLAVLDAAQREIDLFRKYKAWYGSAFFVMQKDSSPA